MSTSKAPSYLCGSVAVLLFCGGTVACRDRSAPQAVMANESLRLTAEQIKVAETAADGGDAAAAKRLWHHYTFVAGDFKKGETWKATYGKLSQESADSK